MTQDPLRLEINLLGPFEVRLYGQALTGFTTDKVRALLAYLAANPGEPYRREYLAGLLWPESTESLARSSLRNALSVLRRLLAEREAAMPALQVTAQTIEFCAPEETWVDLTAFRRDGHDGADDEEAIHALQSALTHYRAPFLEGFTLADAAQFEEWLTVERERCHRRAMDLLEQLAAIHQRRGELDLAIGVLQRQLTYEPWLEEVHRRLMTLLAAAGQRSEALAQYRRCRQLLATELGVEPSADTEALHEQIRAAAGLPQPLSFQPLPLPVALTPLVGRRQELDDLAALLARPDVRLATLLGMGGIGKSHLAIEVAHVQQPRFPDGVCFVELASLRDPDFFAAHVGQTLGAVFDADAPPIEQLINHLRGKRLLLILDNLEHLLAVRTEIVALLREAPFVQILCTSRVRLDIQAEHVVRLDGLRLPSAEAQEGDSEALDGALALYEQRAQQVDRRFQITAENLTGVVRICRAVAGHPLAIILAASWSDMLAPASIAEKIDASQTQLFSLLDSDLQDLSPRHRSLQAILDSVWTMLTLEEQDALAKLSVFRGSFSPDAAEAIAGASLQCQRRLLAKSCLQRAHDGATPDRYQLHELMRQFGAGQLHRMGSAEHETQDLHAGYYIRLLQAREPDLKRSEPGDVIRTLTLDGENIRAAWRWACEHGQRLRLNRGLDPLCQYYEWTGRAVDGIWACQVSLAQLNGDATALEERLRVRVLSWLALFARVGGQYEASATYYADALTAFEALVRSDGIPMREQAPVLLNFGRQALYTDDFVALDRFAPSSRQLYADLADDWGEAQALDILGWGTHNRGRYAQCVEYATTALAIRRSLGDTHGLGNSLMMLGMVYSRLGRLEASRSALEESLVHWRKCGDRQGVSSVLSEIGVVGMLSGDPEQGMAYHAEALAILREMGLPMWVALDLCTYVVDIYLHGGYNQTAAAMLNEGLPIARRHGIAWFVGSGLVRQAMLALVQGEPRRAVALADESRSWLNKIERLDDLGESHWVCAMAACVAGDLELARRQAMLGQEIVHATDHYGLRCTGMVVDAMLARAQGRTDRASEAFAAAQSEPFVANSHYFAALCRMIAEDWQVRASQNGPLTIAELANLS